MTNISTLLATFKVSHFFLLAITLVTFISCVSDKEEININIPNSTLNIHTRSVGNTTGEKISYPIYIYVFDNAGHCVEQTVVTSEAQPISFLLQEGTFNVYALAGAEGENYELPAKESVSPKSTIPLKIGMHHADLMTANNVVTLKQDETNTLTLSLTRRVMMLKEVDIQNIPNDVKAVALTIAPLHEFLCLDGTYSGTNGSHTMNLVKQSDGKTWKSSNAEYLLSAADGSTLTVSITNSTGTKSYSFSCDDQLQANYQLNIRGTYTTKSEITLAGSITGALWAGERNINFSFDENGSSKDPDSNPNDNTIPNAGSLYRGCYVLSVTNKTAATATLFLLSPHETAGLSYDINVDSELDAAVSNALTTFNADGISGWRLPDEEEARNICATYEAINNKFITTGGLSLATSGNYYYRKTNGTIGAFKSGYTSLINAFVSQSSILRPVTTLKLQISN